MKASHEQIKKEQAVPTNSAALEKLIQESANRLADIDAERKELNEEAAEMRAKLKDAGIMPQAFMSKYTQFKKLRTQKEGYRESEEICFEALNKMDQGVLFKFMDKPEKEEKPAKEKKSVGEQQAEAIMEAVN